MALSYSGRPNIMASGAACNGWPGQLRRYACMDRALVQDGPSRPGRGLCLDLGASAFTFSADHPHPSFLTGLRGDGTC
ncbi:MAG: hypothetical protein RID11_19550 [Roseovarius sp.]|jgi:hypothetical protein|uniref:hypothetical protein n=1 Tax=Roseovarius sp. TaxID=1486281 RepID=UPI0032EB15E5